jgi:NDP-sugar pyrophosphorylase family protein
VRERWDTVVCPVGGLGRRLGISRIPKAAVDVCGRRLLDRSLIRFQEAGVRRVYLPVGPWAAWFAEHYGGAAQAGLRGLELHLVGTGPDATLTQAVAACAARCGPRFVYWDGDIVAPAGALQALIAAHDAYGAPVTVACSPLLRAPTHLHVQVDGPVAVAAWAGRPTGDQQFLCGLGAYVVDQSFGEYLSERAVDVDDIDVVAVAWRQAGGSLAAWVHRGPWFAIHTAADLSAARSAAWVGSARPRPA